MRCGRLPTGETQTFYFPDDHPSMPGWFKGMEQIIREWGLWPEDSLPTQCHEFKCPPGHVNCCCRHMLFCQPDFTDQRSVTTVRFIFLCLPFSRLLYIVDIT